MTNIFNRYLAGECSNTTCVRFIAQQCFCVSVSILLCLTVLAKIIAFVKHEQFLVAANGVFPWLSTGEVLAFATALEIATSIYMFLRRKHLSAMVACGWLVGVLVSYRILKRILYVAEPCRCLGGLLDWTGISPQVIA
ncbi:MAG TPA: hypothetical protein VNX46_02045, partial [Candidatus Acidoferrum sp.]|nr:hypothetical protein [Candidatus Acidoferrum sp.]